MWIKTIRKPFVVVVAVASCLRQLKHLAQGDMWSLKGTWETCTRGIFLFFCQVLPSQAQYWKTTFLTDLDLLIGINRNSVQRDFVNLVNILDSRFNLYIWKSKYVSVLYTIDISLNILKNSKPLVNVWLSHMLKDSHKLMCTRHFFCEKKNFFNVNPFQVIWSSWFHYYKPWTQTSKIYFLSWKYILLV